MAASVLTTGFAHDLQKQEQVLAAKIIRAKLHGLTYQKIETIRPWTDLEERWTFLQTGVAKNNKRIEELFRSITSQNVSAQVKFDLMQRAVAICPKVNMGYRRKNYPFTALLKQSSYFHMPELL